MSVLPIVVAAAFLPVCALAAQSSSARSPAAAELAGVQILATKASEIVLGKVLSRREGLGRSTDGSEMLLKFRVEQVLKGSLAAGAVVTIGRPPDTPTEPNNVPTAGSLKARHVIPQFRYILFLERAASRNGYRVVGGATGTFGVRGNFIDLYDERPESGARRAPEQIELHRFMKAIAVRRP